MSIVTLPGRPAPQVHADAPSLRNPDGAAAVAVVGSIDLSLAIDRALRGLLRSLRAHSLFIAIVGAHLVAAYSVQRFIAVPVPFSLDLYGSAFAVLTATLLIVLAGAYVFRVMVVTRPPQLARYLLSDLTTRYVTVDRVCSALPVLLLIPVIMASFSYLKSMIPLFAPYDWDSMLASWDLALHGGRHPWQWLQPVLGHPYVSFLVNLVYNLWYLLLYAVMIWQTFSVARPRLRMRYVLTLVLIWVLLGNVMATAMASVGPVYFARVTGLPDPFAPLMDYLRAANDILPIWAVTTQDYVWNMFAQGKFDIGSGISAMPSVHVATSFSFALLGFATSRRLGIAFSVFTVLILVGSVHLGWHYAIDGYVAIIATWIIWRALGWLLERPLMIRLLWGTDALEVPARSRSWRYPSAAASSID
jgi:PAP2 superfamily protein